ncbi:hypothetical protein HYPBUDRAFT_146681 [Hyphopichia burtonii NRRL Y-1933]|uniref:GYF domain-containing protein n=1 Tax=Hyphopichia burtonii NRRL Y-1933 TaxID=984485 RepID=A0A1E4RSZ1_9ASCO|nr:hypothetical protein HYPBUDRAFT_146681 [Hyphopichia burtonii NRRL Y-1933]ODV70331.1 hypothetical protein HYPBUDRAFT_146681 [Hyphopichia burtonii NRRL Y-1933]
MSQTSWTRKSQLSDTSNTLDNTEVPLQDQPASGYYNPSGVIIPPNKGSKHYSMDEVFKVWYDNKERILNTISSNSVTETENYKVSEPNQIYHLDLQNLNSESTKETPVTSQSPKQNANDLNESLANLSIVDPPNQTLNGAANEPVRSSQGPPPGIFPKSDNPVSSNPISETPLLHPSQIEWFYLDPSGNEQGPFNGSMMQEWLTDGYLNLDLMIRRKEEGQFQTLKQLCDSLENYIQPFQVPLPDLSYAKANDVSHMSVQNPNTAQPQTQQFDQFQTPQNTRGLHQPPPPPPQQQPSLPFGNQHPSQFHQFLSHGPGNLGAANMRLNTTMGSQSNLFGNDFMSPQDPFSATPLSSLANPAFTNNQFGIDAVNPSGLGSFNQPLSSGLHMPSLLQQQIQSQQQPVLSRANSGWGIDPSSGFMGSTPTTPVNVSQPLASQLTQPAPLSPWISAAQSQSRVSSPFVPSSNLPSNDKIETNSNSVNYPNTNHQHVDDHVLNQIHNSVTDILSDGEDHSSNNLPVKLDQISQQIPEPVPEPKPFSQPVPEPVHESIPEPVNEQTSGSVIEQQQQYQQPGHPSQQEQQEPSKQGQQDTPKQSVETESPIQELQASKSKETPSIENLKPASQPQQQLAPWAAATVKTESQKKPTLTLKEIQKLEAEKLEKQKQELRNEKAAAVAAAARQLAEEEKQQQLSEKPGLPKTSSWATNTKPVVAKKTLAEIQKEEAEAAAKAKANSAAAAIAMNNSTSMSSSTSKQSFANAAANSVSKDDGAWTTVTSKKQPVTTKKPTTPVITNNSIKSSPQLLRSVSASKSNVPTNTVDYNGIREEFLIWARSNMTNLYPTVSKDDLLDIFITLPTNQDSSQLIAETIYSSSAIMDGRRFSQEFLKRKSKVDQTIGASDDLDWQSAIVSSADKVSTVDENGWSTSVKPKKKGRKH